MTRCIPRDVVANMMDSNTELQAILDVSIRY